MSRIQVVWFKRDLRWQDHAPLAEAAARGPVLPLYLVEPALWQQPDTAGRHWDFIRDSLLELRAGLAALGAPLVVRSGEAERLLERLHRRIGDFELWSHEETGNDWTYQRDRRVADWCRARAIPWTELPQNGVIRRLSSRQGWATRWEQFMRQPLAATPAGLQPVTGIDPGAIPELPDLGLGEDPCPGRQAGGRVEGERLLHDFLHRRGQRYHLELSSPLSAESSCSRLSPHLAWGTLSLREVTQATAQRLRTLPREQTDWKRALAAFNGRLHWHCHFIQKLESEPELEFRNAHRAYDGLREDEFSSEHFDAWRQGRTGLPLVDACMRALAATGWINFRMRAMLVSFAAYQLWLHWREPGLHLARLYTDYEPGIHWSQMQMQSGTTGINTVRLYNPVKQSQDQDPHGRFLRHWLPELAHVPAPLIHQPWKLSATERRQYRVGDYPPPVVDPLESARQARERIHAVRKGEGHRQEAQSVQARHGSRKAGLPQVSERKAAAKRAARKPAGQTQLDL